MTPQELEIVYQTIEHMAEQYYLRGQADQKVGKTLENKAFLLNKQSRLAIKTSFVKSTVKR